MPDDDDLDYQLANDPLPDGHQGPLGQSWASEHDRNQDARLDAIDPFILSPGEVASDPGAQGPSASQRLRIHVPNVNTTLSLGALAPGGSIRELDTGAPNFTGFGAHTVGHVFVSASGPAADSTATIQATGNVIMQSAEGMLWAGSKEQALFASQANAIVSGGGGVIIAGGAAVTWAPNAEPDGTSPKPPGWMSGFGDVASVINRTWAATDAVVAAGTAVSGFVGASVSAGKFTFGGKLAVANLIFGNVGGGIVSGLGAADSDPIGGTVIHGTGGVIVGSTLTMGLYSLAGTTLASVLGVSILAPSVGITGIHDATLEAKSEVQVSSGNTAVVSASQKLDLDSGMETVLGGRKVLIGQDSSKRKWKTNNIVLLAGNGVDIISDESSGFTAINVLEASRDTRVVRIGAEKHVAIASTKKVSLGVKSAGEIKLSCIDSSTDYFKLKKDDAELCSSTRITHKVKSTAVEITDGKIELAVGGTVAKLDRSSFLTPSGKFDSSGVKLKGQIRLG